MPPWPFYRRHPLKWLKAIPVPSAEPIASSVATGGAAEAEKPKKKKN